jgi:hypothetical protein
MLKTGIAGLIGVLIGAALVSVVTAQQAEPTDKVLTAQELRIVDPEGKTRILLSHSVDGAPGLRMLDADGTVRASVNLREGQAALALCDKAGNPRATYGFTAAGRAVLGLRDENGKARAVLRVAQDGSPSLEMSDADGKAIWEAPQVAAPANPGT